jgi:hypothetical protein
MFCVEEGPSLALCHRDAAWPIEDPVNGMSHLEIHRHHLRRFRLREPLAWAIDFRISRDLNSLGTFKDKLGDLRTLGSLIEPLPGFHEWSRLGEGWGPHLPLLVSHYGNPEAYAELASNRWK